MEKIKVTIWNEFRHEKTDEHARALYPNGIHATIGEFLSKDEEIEVRLAALDDPEQGLPDSLLNDTDVLIWWGHMAHGEVKDELVTKIQRRVLLGRMSFIALHSAHHSKPFRAILGTTGNLQWGRNQREIMWNLLPTHPIAAGIPQSFFIEEEELYAEPFFIPQLKKILHFTKLTIIHINITNKTSAVRIRLDKNTSFTIASVSAILYENMLYSR